MSRIDTSLWVAVGAAFALAVTAAPAANIVTLTNGKTIEAKSIKWMESSQEYRVQTREDIVIPVARKDVEKLEIDTPPELTKAEQLIAAGTPDGAIPLLEGVISNYKMLVWDDKAREMLARLYIDKKEPKKAVNLLEDMIKSMNAADISLAQRRLYWDALLAAGLTSTLKKELDEAIATAPRETAAYAQMKRGDMLRAGDQKMDAVLDYLRTHILFKDVKDVQAEALGKAAEIMDELRDPHAADLRKELLRDYPQSEWARKAQGKT